MKLALLVTTLILASGCGKFSRMWTNLTGDLTYKCAKGGVLLAQSDSGLTVLLDRNNKTVPCEE